MGTSVFPSLPGVTWPKRTPVWQTRVQKSVSGKETRLADWTYPQWKWALDYEFLRSLAQTELQMLIGFYNARQGGFDSFLYSDSTDDTVTGQPIGVGDGVTTTFQLVRSFGGFTEPVFAPVISSLVVRVNGATQGAYVTVAWGLGAAAGQLTLPAPPSPGYPVTVDMQYQWPCRFTTDSQDFEGFANGFWSTSKLEFQSLKAPE